MITQSPVPQLVFVQLGSAPCRWLAPNVKAHVVSFGGSVFVVSDQVGTLRDAPRWGAEPVGFTPTAETSALLAHMSDRVGFRRGFWSYTAMRFAAIEQLQAQAKDLAIVHIESDVVLNPTLDLSAFGRVGSGIQFPRLGFGKVAAAVLFSRSAKDIGRLREFVFEYVEANPGSNEMAGLDEFRRCSGDLVGVLPTAPSPTSPVFRGELDLSTRADLSRLTSEFNGVFDVAGVGQYLFGTDPRNAGGWRWVRRSFDDQYVDPRRIDVGLWGEGLMAKVNRMWGYVADRIRRRLASAVTSAVIHSRHHLPDTLRRRLEHHSQASLTRLMSKSASVDGLSIAAHEAKTKVLRGFLPGDPLADPLNSGSSIEIIIPAGPREIDMLHEVVRCATSGVSNPLSGITVVTPEAYLEQTRQALLHHPQEAKLRTVSDEEIVPDDVACLVDRMAPAGKRSWLWQQVVKWNAVLKSEAANCLILDADTRLTRARQWVRGGVQVLTPVAENHLPYKLHIDRAFGGSLAPLPISFVSHHQLVQADLLREMLDELGGPVEGQLAWLATIDSREASGASEYDTYATWVVRRHPERVALSYWGNALAPRSARLDGFLRDPNVYSISSHWYLDN